MFEPRDSKKGGSHPRSARTSEHRRVVQPLSVVRGGRPKPAPPSEPPPSEPPPSGGDTSARGEPGRSGASQHTLLQLWALANQRQRWSSLVLVPAHPGGSGRQAAAALLEVGSKQSATPVRFLNAEGLELGKAAHLVRELEAYVAQGDRVVVLLDSVLSNPVGLEVALAVERALLCVTLGDSDFSSARRTVELVGKERFLGSVTLQPSSGVAKK